MGESKSSAPLNNSDIEKIVLDAKGDLHGLSLETLTLLLNTDRLRYLENKIDKEFIELKQGQNQVVILHNLTKKINAQTNPKGELDCSSDPELKQLLEEAKKLGVDIKDGKYKYTKEERDRLLDNIRMTTEDINVVNEMKIQKVNRYTNERYESYKIVHGILKAIHEAKTQSARAIK